jgi:hypothetical protein
MRQDVEPVLLENASKLVVLEEKHSDGLLIPYQRTAQDRFLSLLK